MFLDIIQDDLGNEWFLQHVTIFTTTLRLWIDILLAKVISLVQDYQEIRIRDADVNPVTMWRLRKAEVSIGSNFSSI